MRMNEKKIISKQYAKPHPFLAGLIDFYLLSVVISGSIAVIEAVIKRPIVKISLMYLVIVLISEIIAVIIYNKVFSKKCCWLSPGEIIAGRSIDEDKKETPTGHAGLDKWCKPHCRK